MQIYKIYQKIKNILIKENNNKKKKNIKFGILYKNLINNKIKYNF